MAYSVYVNQTWVDGSSSTPISAARLGVIETGVLNSFYSPAVQVTHNAAQSITASTETTLAFNTENFDQAGNAADTQHDNVTNNSRLTARYAGIYLITAQAEWASNPTSAYLLLRLNGTTTIMKHQPVSTDYRLMLATTMRSLAVNDYVEARVLQASGGAININSSSSFSPIFSMVRVA